MIRTADVPKHIAFIMDGNRRYSRERNISSRDAYMGGGQAISRVCTSRPLRRTTLGLATSGRRAR